MGFEKFTHKKRFYTQKHQKNSMSKNGVKSRLTLLFKELWVFFVFQKKKSILEGDFGENGFLENLRTKNVFTLSNIKKSQCLKMVSEAV